MTKWQKKLNIVHFEHRVPCPFCPEGSETYPSNLSLARHVLKEHNWNKDFLKGFEVVETHGAVMIVEKKRLECFGTATTQDCCLQCPDNEECVKETMKRFNQKNKED